jgi:hypothetical protein
MARKPTFGGWKPPKNPFKAFKPIKPEWPKNRLPNGLPDLAIRALREGRCLAFQYHGCFRVVGVFTVGLTQANRPAMSAWQVDGQANDIAIPGWGIFCFDECFDVALSDHPTPPAPSDYRKGAKQFRVIHAEF